MKRVYFIKPIGMDGPVKIGCSTNAELRRTNLAAWCPINLELLADIPGDEELEGRIHHYLIDDHERQEWFRHSRRLRALIKSIKDGAFNPDEMPVNIGPIRHAAKASDSPLVREYRALYAAFVKNRFRAGKLIGAFAFHMAPAQVASASDRRQLAELQAIKRTLQAHVEALGRAAA